MPNPPLTRRQRRAVVHFLAERDALFALLETDRLTPLPREVELRGRQILGRIGVVLRGLGHAPQPLPDSSPLMPADLMLALVTTSSLLTAHFRSPGKGLADPHRQTYPRAVRVA